MGQNRTKVLENFLNIHFSRTVLLNFYLLIIFLFNFCFKWKLTFRRPLRRKLRKTWFFNISKVKESSFFKLDLYAHLLENTNLGPTRFHFSVSFISRSSFESDGFIAYSNERDWREKTMFIHINQPLITSFYMKRVPIFWRISD